MSYYHRENCRLCDSLDLTSVLSLTPTPPANAFVRESELDKEQICYPLELWFCQSCTHLQLLDVVDPELLFSDYVYVSGTSPVFVKHFQDYAHSIIDFVCPAQDELIIDIGSNDGTLLRQMKDAGYQVLGIEPAKDIARQATESGIETINAFFNKDIALQILQTHGSAKIITANNVFAHMDDLRGVTEAIEILLEANGIFVFEVQYLLDLYQGTLFDMIYHEHLDYHSLQALLTFFQRCNMEIVRAERVSPHGGSLRCYVKKAGGEKAIDDSVETLLQLERSVGLDKADTFIAFGRDIDAKGQKLKNMLAGLKTGDKHIAAFGAPAKATTLMYHYGLDKRDIDFIVDDSPLKQGLYSPGLHIPVLPGKVLAERKVDYLLILAWNFAGSIIEKNQEFVKNGGHFVVPLPEPEVI